MMIVAHNKESYIVCNAFEDKKITHAFHDIDGTHSIIRDWPPVMSIVLNDVIENGLPKGFDSEENIVRLIASAGIKPLPETDMFCVESAGLSALTQMEWAIRRAVETGTVKINCDKNINIKKVQLIWGGTEIFDDMPETNEMSTMLTEKTPRLFKFYEAVLNGFCRDKNLALAREKPNDFRINGSMEFLTFLKNNGVKNYFVTGAVVQRGMGMYEEVESLGYKIGKGEIIEGIVGSTWTEKVPKNVIMNRLLDEFGVEGKNVLVIGDGRAEISAGVEMGALTISRLPEDAVYLRKLHKSLGTNIMVSDYTDDMLYEIFRTA